MTEHPPRRGRPPKDAQTRSEEEILKKKMESEIISFRKERGLLWKHLVKEFGFDRTEYSAYAKIGHKDSTYQSVKRFYDRIFDKTKNVVLAATEFGSYQRAEYEHIEGNYALIRPSTDEDGVIYGYKSNIKWDGKVRCHYIEFVHDRTNLNRGNITFIREHSSLWAQFGHGLSRANLLLKISPDERDLSGIMTTMLKKIATKNYIPAAIPVVLVKEVKHIPLGEGYISKNHQLYGSCLNLIKRVDGDYAVILGWWNK